MKFPNAANGVKKLYTAEILNLIGTIALIIAYVLTAAALVAAGNDSVGGAIGSGLGAMILFIGSGVLAIIAYILKFVGISKASQDEPAFKSAFVCAIISLAFLILASAFPALEVLTGIASTLQRVFELMITVFVIQGVIRLADKRNRGDISTRGASLMKLLLVIYGLIIIANIVATVFGLTTSLIALILLIASGVLAIIQYFMYLGFLSKAAKMLSEDR